VRQLLGIPPRPSQQPRTGPLFYGWVIVGVAAVASMCQVSFFNPVLGVFMGPLSKEFGWDRAIISAAITIGSVGGALISPLVGWILDRWGSRLVVAASGALQAACLLALAFTPSLWWFYLFYAIGRTTATGGTSLGATVTVSNWFVRNRGLALGVTLLGNRAGMALLPLAVQLVLLVASWRTAWAMLWVIVLSLSVLPSLRFLRRRPEDMGLLPDGLPSEASAASTPEPTVTDWEEQWSLREAVRTPALWLLTLATSQVFMVGAAVNLHQMPHLVDQGLSSTLAVGVVSTFAVSGGVGGLLSGLAQRRLGARWTLAASLAGAASGLVLLIYADNPGLAYLYGVWYGLVFGSMITMMQVVYAEYFGREALGSIRGAVAPIQMAFNATGPLLAGWSFDVSGSYVRIFWAYAGLLLLAAIWVTLARPPRRSARAT
jgi:MFS family permease